MTPRNVQISWSLVALFLLVAVALGASGALALASPSLPSALRTAEPLGSVTVTSRGFDDSRTVELSLETGAQRQLSSPRAGTLTATECRPGGPLSSGKRLAAVDGHTLVGLATSEPLWRDIRERDSGDDVRALQAELARLGHRIRVDAIAGAETLKAAGTVLGMMAEIDAVPYDSFVWLPSPTVSASTCPAPLGGTIEAGQPLATLPVALTGLRVTSLPKNLVPGPRTLAVAGTQLEAPSDGKVSDPTALAAIAALTEYASAISQDGEPTLNAELALTQPVDAVVVPPSALFGSQGTSACVASSGKAIPVEVVGSELGEAFVVPRTRLTNNRVDLSPEALPCG